MRDLLASSFLASSPERLITTSRNMKQKLSTIRPNKSWLKMTTSCSIVVICFNVKDSSVYAVILSKDQLCIIHEFKALTPLITVTLNQIFWQQKDVICRSSEVAHFCATHYRNENMLDKSLSSTR